MLSPRNQQLSGRYPHHGPGSARSLRRDSETVGDRGHLYPADVRRPRLAALAITVGFVLGGCSGDIAVGPCTFRVSTDGLGNTALKPPYRVSLKRDLRFSGDGWTEMKVEARNSSGVETGGVITRQDMRDGLMGISLDRPGVWQLRISDRVSGCRQEFVVEMVR